MSLALPAARARSSAGFSWPRLSWDRLTLVLLLVVAGLILITFQDYGITWDEDVHNWYGVFVLDYYLSGFHDLRALHWLDLFNYGAAFDMTAAALNRFSPFGVYETRHLLDAFIGLLGIAGAGRLGRALGGPRAGFIAALFLALTPNYYGQRFNNPKDIPFAVGMVWAVYHLVRLLPALPRPPASRVAKLGIVTGLTLGVRVGGLLIFGYLGLLLLLAAFWDGIAARRGAVVARALAVSLWRGLLPALLIAYPVMLFFWPWAQRAPLAHPLAALATFSHETFPFATLFDGRYVPASDLPWSYLPVYILLALPELILLLLALAPVAALAGWRQGRAAPTREKTLGLFLLAFAILFPVGYAVAIRAVLFDGMRHFIFVLPLIAVVAALVADLILDRLARSSLRGWAYGALAIYGALHISVMVRLHPDEYVYYNSLIGGVRGAEGAFKLDYWANSYAEAVHGLARYLRAEYGADFMRHDFTVAVCGPPISAAYYFPRNFIFVPEREAAQFFIAFTKDHCDKALSGTPIYQVTRMGALLSVVLDRRAILAAAPAPARLAGGR